MAKRKVNPLFFNMLIDRIFMLFSGATDAIVAENLGIVRQVVQGWRSGKSKPTLEQLEKIVEITSADWQWLMTGKSESIDYLIERFFPKVDKSTFNGRYDNYEYTRINLLGTIMFPWRNHEGLQDLVYAIAVTWQSAMDKKYPDVLKDAKSKSMDGYKYINFMKNYEPSNEFFSKSVKLSEEIRASHVVSQRMSELHHIRDMHAQEFRNSREDESKPLDSEWPVRGKAAADDSNGTRVPDTDDFDDSINPPEGLTCVPVTGDSMSPLVLDGQFVLIDNDREGFEVDGGIVVASIREPDADDDRAEKMTGTFVKRCYDGGNGLYYFASINDYSPFSAWIDHCRIWPVIGVWFAGKGKPPEE